MKKWQVNNSHPSIIGRRITVSRSTSGLVTTLGTQNADVAIPLEREATFRE